MSVVSFPFVLTHIKTGKTNATHKKDLQGLMVQQGLCLEWPVQGLCTEQRGLV